MPVGDRLEETRVALCRCGASRNKSYCDNSHVETGFRDTAINVPQQFAEDVAEKTTVTVPDGPVLIDGPVAVCGADASEASGVKCALCRCGKSQAKPFYDGSHAVAALGQTDSRRMTRVPQRPAQRVHRVKGRIMAPRCKPDRCGLFTKRRCVDTRMRTV